MSRTLVAYFSCSGTTKALAARLAQVTGADLYEITPAVPYTAADLDWQNKQARSTVEMADRKSRPAVAGRVADMAQYDTVFVGFPIWWHVAPTVVNTFLEGYDFSGKTVVPFATSGSSPVGDTEKWLRVSCSQETKWKPAKRFEADADAAALKQWVAGLKL